MYDRANDTSRLTPLMAQQMSGRAGRRGLDQQGNVVYVGSRANFIRQLMMGKVSKIVGRDAFGGIIEPRYPALMAQAVLSRRYTGMGRVATLGGEPLHDYVDRMNRNAAVGLDGKYEHGPVPDNSYAFTKSRELMAELGFIDNDEMYPAGAPFSSYQHLSLIWTMRDFGVQGITLGMLLTDIYNHLKPTAHLITEKKTEADKAKMVDHRDKFTALMLILVDRREYKPPVEGVPAAEAAIPALQDSPYFNTDEKRQLLADWEQKFAELQERLPEDVRDPVKPGTKLDGTLFACMIDRNLCQELSDNTKQTLKDRYWSVGQIVRFLHNCTWTDDEMYKVVTLVSRNVYLYMRYLNGELIRGMVDFENVSDISFERSEEKAFLTKKQAATAEQGAAGGVGQKAGTDSANAINPEVRDIWQDEQPVDAHVASTFVHAVQWTKAVTTASARIASDAANGGEITPELLTSIQGGYVALKGSKVLAGDRALLSFLHKYPTVPPMKELQAYVEELGKVMRQCGQGGAGTDQSLPQYTTPEGREQATIGALLWFGSEVRPALASKMFVVLQLLYDAEPGLLSEDAIKAWYATPSAEFAQHLPAGAFGGDVAAGVAAIEAIKTDSKMAEFIEWLDEAEESDSGEESD